MVPVAPALTWHPLSRWTSDAEDAVGRQAAQHLGEAPWAHVLAVLAQ
jgi:hypothetical protein